MLDGYPLRKYDWKDWVLMIISSSLVLQVVFSMGMVNVGPVVMSVLSDIPITREILEQFLFSGTVYGTLASLPITLLIVYWRKIPLFNRRQLTKEQSFIIRGLTKSDWKFLLKYIPTSYFLYTIGQVVLAYFLGASEPVNQIAVESLFDYIPLWQMFLMIVVVAPITEELLFRGILLFPGEHLQTTWLRVLISAVLFGFVHNPTDILSLYTYVGMGLIFSYASKRTESIEAAIVYHFLNNLIGFLAILFV
jgi:membrane protease YdiL (CAAX protease family)